MKTKILFFFLLIPGVMSFSQNVLNGGFENWSSRFLFEEPDSFLTTNGQLFYMGGPTNVIKTTDAFDGQYAAELQTITLGTDTMMGFLIYGTPKPGGGGIIGKPYTRKPDTLTFYAKYNIIPGDQAVVVIGFTIHALCDTTIMFPVFFTGQNNTYTKYKIPISWPPLGCSPDTMMAIFSSSNLDPPRRPGSILFVDKLEFIEGNSHYDFPNGNLENWTSQMSAYEADNWMSVNFLCDPGNLSATQSTDRHEGNYSISVKNVVTQPGDTLGIITNGRMGNGGPQGGQKVNLNPERLTGFYKYIPVGLDTALAGLFSYRYDAGLDSSILVEQNMIKLPPSSSWTSFEIPMTYDSSPNIDTLNITFAAGNYFSAPVVGLGGILMIDALNLSYYHMGVDNIFPNQIHIYPNPANDYIIFDQPVPASASEINLYDLSGKRIKNSLYNSVPENGKIRLDTRKLGNGVYFVETVYGKTRNKGSFIIQR